jgi:hypothetical protein
MPDDAIRNTETACTREGRCNRIGYVCNRQYLADRSPGLFRIAPENWPSWMTLTTALKDNCLHLRTPSRGHAALVTQWLESRGFSAHFWTADRISADAQLGAFSQTLQGRLSPDLASPADFTCGAWEMALDGLQRGSSAVPSRLSGRSLGCIPLPAGSRPILGPC